MCWTGDGKQLNRDMPEIVYVLGKEGGEIWSDFFAIPDTAPHSDAAYALINFLLDARVIGGKGSPVPRLCRVADSRVNALLPAEMREATRSSIRRPSFSMRWNSARRSTLTDPQPRRTLARFKSA